MNDMIVCDKCAEIFHEDAIMIGTPIYAPYGDTEKLMGYEGRCPYCGGEGDLRVYEEEDHEE